MKEIIFVSVFIAAWCRPSLGKELLTNSARFVNAPPWLGNTQVNRAADRVQNFMEWSIRRAEVQWFDDESSFTQAHGMGPNAVAVTNKTRNIVYLGPKVTQQNFDQVFAHELVHIVSGQKYKEAIPIWLEEGVANYISKARKVDYSEVKKMTWPLDVYSLAHPLRGSPQEIRQRYMASQALTEFIASKCDFRGLLRLSVQRKLENYLENICRIKNLSQEFEAWVKKKPQGPAK